MFCSCIRLIHEQKECDIVHIKWGAMQRLNNTITKFMCALIGIGIALCAFCLVACSPNNISVKLYDGENYISEKTVEKDSEYDLGSIEKSGYLFLGWYSEKDGGSAYTDANGKSVGMKWKEDNVTTLYAHWQAKTYRISLNYCGATANTDVTEISAVYDTRITDRLPVPEKSGFSFLGWYTAENQGTKLTDELGDFIEGYDTYKAPTYSTADDGTAIFAHWSKKTVTYSFYAEGESVNKSVTYEVGAVITELTPVVKDNYCFVDWCFDQTGLSAMTLPYVIPNNSESNILLFAKFEHGTNDILSFATIVATADREYEVTYSGDAEEIIIPDSYYGKKITRIKRIEAPNAKRVILPQTVKDLGNSVFEGCANLETVNIPFGVKTIPQSAFLGCKKLKSIIIPNNVESVLKTAFMECEAIDYLTLPANVKTIGVGAFAAMSNLKEFSVDSANEDFIAPDGVLYKKIGNSLHLVQYPLSKTDETYELESGTVRILEAAFGKSQINSINIGGRVTTVDDEAFAECDSLVSVTLSSDANSLSIGQSAFYKCKNLKAMKIEMSKIPTLGDNAFVGVSAMFSVYVTSNVINNYKTANGWREVSSVIFSIGTIYGDYAVEEYDGQYAIRQYFGTDKTVDIPEIINAHRIVKISDNAFSYSNMEAVTIPQYVAHIGNESFKNCVNLKTVIVKCEPPTLGTDAFSGLDDEYGIYVDNTTDVLAAYKSASGWMELSNRIWTYTKH